MRKEIAASERSSSFRSDWYLSTGACMYLHFNSTAYCCVFTEDQTAYCMSHCFFLQHTQHPPPLHLCGSRLKFKRKMTAASSLHLLSHDARSIRKRNPLLRFILSSSLVDPAPTQRVSLHFTWVVRCTESHYP